MSVVEPYASGRSGNVTGIRSRSRLVQRRLASFVCAVAAFPLALVAAPGDSPGAASSPPPAATNQIAQTNSQELIQAYLQLHEQLRTTLLAIEQGRQENREAAAQTTESLSKALQSVQETFSAQRARDLEAMRSSNTVMLIVVGTFAAMSFLSMLLMSYFQWRMSKGLAEISAALPVALGLGAGAAVPALGPVPESSLSLPGAAEHPAKPSPGQPHHPNPALGARTPANLVFANQLFPDARFWLRRRQLRALRTAVIVGLICAAVLALVLYALTYGKLGFGVFHRVLKI